MRAAARFVAAGFALPCGCWLTVHDRNVTELCQRAVGCAACRQLDRVMLLVVLQVGAAMGTSRSLLAGDGFNL